MNESQSDDTSHKSYDTSRDDPVRNDGKQRDVHTMSVQGDVVHGDKIAGDKIAGDKVMGDKITVGDIVSSSGVAIGRGAHATVTTGLNATDATQLFKAIYAKIEARPEDQNVDKDEMKETVQRIQQEASLGDQVNERKLDRWLTFLARMAPDIFDVTIATLASPSAGFGIIAKKVAERAKEQEASKEQ